MVYTEETSPTWSTFTLTGHQTGQPQTFITELSGRMAALNPRRELSFDLQGAISGISPEDLTNLVGTLDITGETLAIEVDFKCREGSFLKGQSKLTSI